MDFLPVIALINDDLPTLDLPAKQTSSLSAGGRPFISTTPFTKSTCPANSLRPFSREKSSGSGLSLNSSINQLPLVYHPDLNFHYF